jgi:hypothetical protein
MKIKLIGPNKKVKKRKPTFEEIGLKHQMSQFYSLKSTMEALFGHPMYMELKETTDLAVWRKAMKKLLDAIEVSIRHSVKVADLIGAGTLERERLIDAGVGQGLDPGL